MQNAVVLLYLPDSGMHQFNSIDGVDGPKLPFVLVMPLSDLLAFRKVLDRAMNCWEPQEQPAWLQGVSDEVDRRLAEAV